MQRLFNLFIILLFISCSHSDKQEIIADFSSIGELNDKKATIETIFLYHSLQEISKYHILYGHQDDLACDENWLEKDDLTDVKEVTYPAVFGWELGNFGMERNIDSVLFKDIKKWIIRVFEIGGVNTVSLHFNNPISLNNSWDITKAVSQILPGGKKHNYYKKQLKIFAEFNSELVSSKGVQIPIVLRVFHEQNANWYWWGKKYCTCDEYKSLYRFTVNYLRDSLNIHNLIYVYAPDGQFDDYLDRYPGDDFIDIMGFDYYFRNAINEKEIDLFTKKMIELTELARIKNKLAVISEAGNESIPDSLWYSKVLLNPLKENKEKIRLGYFLVRRNISKTCLFAPFASHSSKNDFHKFYSDSAFLFLNNIPNLYSAKKLPD